MPDRDAPFGVLASIGAAQPGIGPEPGIGSAEMVSRKGTFVTLMRLAVCEHASNSDQLFGEDAINQMVARPIGVQASRPLTFKGFRTDNIWVELVRKDGDTRSSRRSFPGEEIFWAAANPFGTLPP